MDLPMAELIKLAKMVGVMYEADRAYSIWNTQSLRRFALDVPFTLLIRLVLLPITWICRILFYNLDCSNLQF